MISLRGLELLGHILLMAPKSRNVTLMTWDSISKSWILLNCQSTATIQRTNYLSSTCLDIETSALGIFTAVPIQGMLHLEIDIKC